MHLLNVFSSVLAGVTTLQGVAALPQGLWSRDTNAPTSSSPFSPKAFIISMFSPEAGAWYGIPDFNVLAVNITVPGLSMLFPDVHCTGDGQICQLTTGEGEINAATTIASLVASPYFNLTQTYFMIAGIGGVSPELATLGSVTLARFAVQVALQYEFDAREIPANFSTGYVPFGTKAPGQYPTSIYGTEVFELNEALRNKAIELASTAQLNDTQAAAAYRANYASDPAYAAGASGPTIVPCDVATSDNYYSGNLLAEAFDNTTTLLTNGTGLYCSSAQEDNASLEAFLRAAIYGFVDFSRIIVMRTGSDFDRQYPGETATQHLLYDHQNGHIPSIANIYLAGVKIVEGIVNGWDDTFEAGITPTNYIGDIFGSLGGTPDFGPYSGGAPATKRSIEARRRRRV
ncbi:purine nucleoside permease-domain-containing protein [Fomitopsis serialis]|uniref:purine nucleoside permease-domain-containing protein n=1 Tax=Fomitopsis serialis TaxID=139415 RepID=UPI002007D8DA|nr:purine nucleoside permease-domain-containing protein [Neoantrodia serialis]KAH9922651.1 purine nucleoside permease-domain-containing protein [Neoantrodia serialis]